MILLSAQCFIPLFKFLFKFCDVSVPPIPSFKMLLSIHCKQLHQMVITTVDQPFIPHRYWGCVHFCPLVSNAASRILVCISFHLGENSSKSLMHLSSGQAGEFLRPLLVRALLCLVLPVVSRDGCSGLVSKNEHLFPFIWWTILCLFFSHSLTHSVPN